MYFNKEQINQAKKISLVDFLYARGEDLNIEGNYYRIGKSSFVIKNENKYFRNSTNEVGNTIDYLVRHMNYQFSTAVMELIEFSSMPIETPKKEYKALNIEFTKDIRKSIAYLSKHRKIDSKILKWVIDEKLINQTKEKNNICFNILDENKKLVGGELNTSLSFKRFKGFLPNGINGYGFNIMPVWNENIAHICYFESAIDLLSFLSVLGYERFIKSLSTTGYISMGGLKINVLIKANKIIPDHNMFIGTDNILLDNPSKNFLDLVQSRFNNNISFLKLKRDFKDWNQYQMYKVS
jgi:hypothetical protein